MFEAGRWAINFHHFRQVVSEINFLNKRKDVSENREPRITTAVLEGLNGVVVFTVIG